MPSNKKKRTKVPKQDLELMHIDYDRLFDTLISFIRSDNTKRKDLSDRSFIEYHTKGKGMFVVNIMDTADCVCTDTKELFDALIWWNHGDLTANKLPSYCFSDPDYDPDIQDYMLRRNNIEQTFIIALYWNHKVMGRGSRMTTLGQANPFAVHIPLATLNPYMPGEVGTIIKARGRQCAAEGCEVMEGKHKTKCTDCLERECKHTIKPLPGYSLKECSRCRQVVYCSRACQKDHWPIHKLACKELQGMLSAV